MLGTDTHTSVHRLFELWLCTAWWFFLGQDSGAVAPLISDKVFARTLRNLPAL